MSRWHKTNQSRHSYLHMYVMLQLSPGVHKHIDVTCTVTFHYPYTHMTYMTVFWHPRETGHGAVYVIGTVISWYLWKTVLRTGLCVPKSKGTEVPYIIWHSSYILSGHTSGSLTIHHTLQTLRKYFFDGITKSNDQKCLHMPNTDVNFKKAGLR